MEKNTNSKIKNAWNSGNITMKIKNNLEKEKREIENQKIKSSNSVKKDNFNVINMKKNIDNRFKLQIEKSTYQEDMEFINNVPLSDFEEEDEEYN